MGGGGGGKTLICTQAAIWDVLNTEVSSFQGVRIEGSTVYRGVVILE